ncbi:MAG: hypothetical protein A2X36_02655 [Elusimicrobia bacterium GWA2_69_24]|nr:MAG: hypothetical protein A2X36_02655 [Elusimicrobia bacterium GWA2_69_24]HBL15563.1 hypothetical protein [Elusimicrobiota bacterium]
MDTRILSCCLLLAAGALAARAAERNAPRTFSFFDQDLMAEYVSGKAPKAEAARPRDKASAAPIKDCPGSAPKCSNQKKPQKKYQSADEPGSEPPPPRVRKSRQDAAPSQSTERDAEPAPGIPDPGAGAPARPASLQGGVMSGPPEDLELQRSTGPASDVECETLYQGCSRRFTFACWQAINAREKKDGVLVDKLKGTMKKIVSVCYRQARARECIAPELSEADMKAECPL